MTFAEYREATDTSRDGFIELIDTIEDPATADDVRMKFVEAEVALTKALGIPLHEMMMGFLAENAPQD